ncbi:FUSC family protein [Niallia circulans]|uniref:FUSC family protein n=1 Tax=Niallia circulans TaxID=1397 RepID=A0A553SHU1_NIACI|nr:FUSC family protein [Niallia circulans]TRZ36539.1 FUSC family protein [Niallia circulans]
MNNTDEGLLRESFKRMNAVFKQSFKVNKNPFPWLKAFYAGLAAALPVFIGVLFGSFENGLLAGIGGFTYLYVFDIPYVQRAKKIFLVLVSITFSVFIGTILAPYIALSVLMMGVIGALAIFIFSALKINGPSALFFVLCFAMATGMPVDPSLAPIRAGFVFLGGALSWILAMLGWFFHPHNPEIKAVKRVYCELAELIDSVGTSNVNIVRHRVITVMSEAEAVLFAGYASKSSAKLWSQLFLLNEHANLIYSSIAAISTTNDKIPPVLGQAVRHISERIGTSNLLSKVVALPEEMSAEIEGIAKKVVEANGILTASLEELKHEQFVKPSFKTILLGAVDKNSIVFLSSVKYGVVLIIAALIAYSFPFERSYWIPLSCAAVMSGPTIIATFHRAVQRMLGTVIGLLIAGVILITVHNGFVVAFLILCLTFLTELFIVRNYGFAAIFFTASALIMAEYSSQVFDYSYFAVVRVTDILIGSLIGLAGVVLIGRKSASNLLNHFIAKTIRSQGQLLVAMYSNNMPIQNKEQNKMQTNLSNLVTVYQSALGELFGNRARLEALWPVIFFIKQISHELNIGIKYGQEKKFPESELAQWLYAMEIMALSMENNVYSERKELPFVEGFSHLRNEVLNLQKGMEQLE